MISPPIVARLWRMKEAYSNTPSARYTFPLTADDVVGRAVEKDGVGIAIYIAPSIRCSDRQQLHNHHFHTNTNRNRRSH